MKKILFALVLLVSTTMQAQETDKKIFNHMSVGITAGLNGIGADIAMPCTRFLDIRAGFTMMPKIKYNTNLDLSEVGWSQQQALDWWDQNHTFVNDDEGIKARVMDLANTKEIAVQAKTKIREGKVLIDFYPAKKFPFCFTVGAYFGGQDIVSVYTYKEDGNLKVFNEGNKVIDDYNELNGTSVKHLGLELGEQILTPDDKGNMTASIRVKKVKPYVGIGFGRAIPRRRISFMTELGAKFWGSPRVYLSGKQKAELDESIEGNGGEIIKTISKINIYPNLTFRLSGRLF